MSANITITQEESKAINRGVENIFTALKDAKAVKLVIEDVSNTLDNSSAGSLVEFANGQMTNFTEGYGKLSKLTAGLVSVLLDGMARSSQSIQDNATVKTLKGSLDFIEESDADVQKTLKTLGETKLKVSDDAGKPLDYDGILAMVESLKGVTNGLAENYDAVEQFRKTVDKTEYAGAFDQVKENTKALVSKTSDTINDSIIPIIESFGNNTIAFLEEHKANLNKAQLESLEKSKAIMSKFGASLSENQSKAKKAKVSFGSAKGLL